MRSLTLALETRLLVYLEHSPDSVFAVGPLPTGALVRGPPQLLRCPHSLESRLKPVSS